MELHQVSIAAPSTRALGKMKRGSKVRVVQGEGMPLLVSPANYSHLQRSFSKGKGVHMALSPMEIHHNHAEGIFGRRGDNALRFIGRKTGIGSERFKDLAYRAGDQVKPYVQRGIKAGIAAAGTALAASNPELAPVIPFGVAAASNISDRYLDNPGAFGVGGSLAPRSRHIATNVLDAYTGEDNSKLSRANVGTYLANVARAKLQGATGGSGLFAEPPSGGSGLYAEPPSGGGSARGLSVPKEVAVVARARGLRRHRREMSSVGIHGNLLGNGLPPALIPQPLSANFQFAHTLPPAFQSITNSSGY